MHALKLYGQNIRRFSPQARLYLLVATLQGIGMGIFQLFFNFYVLSLGYQRDFLGLLLSVPAITALVVALGAGYISELIGRKRAFISGSVLVIVAQATMLLFPTTTILIIAGIFNGAGSSLFMVTAAPFLIEHSSEQERTHLFSFNTGLRMISSFLGNFLGGSLPLWISSLWHVAPTSSTAYAGALGVTLLLRIISLVPLAQMKVAPTRPKQERPAQPFSAAWEQRHTLSRLLLPSLILSLGAGMLMPFMNIFFRYRFALPDRAIGSLFGIGALGMGLATFIAPLLAGKWGKAHTVVFTRTLSIPFLIILGFVPNLFLAEAAFVVRMALMNLSGPVYQTMIMEKADARSRSIAASLFSMIWNSGRALSPSISGPIQEAYGFSPVFVITITSYIISVYLVYLWFVKTEPHPSAALQATPSETSW